jgi:hypothetical protein
VGEIEKKIKKGSPSDPNKNYYRDINKILAQLLKECKDLEKALNGLSETEGE